MIQITKIKLDIPHKCDACGALKKMLTQVKLIYASEEDRHKGVVTEFFLCYICKDTMHGHLGKYIMQGAGAH